MAVCSFAHCEAALSLQPVEDTLMVLRPGRKVVFQYDLCFVNRLKSQLLISHLFLLFLPIKKMPPGQRRRSKKSSCFLEMSPLFLSYPINFYFNARSPQRTIAAASQGVCSQNANVSKRECQQTRMSALAAQRILKISLSITADP